MSEIANWSNLSFAWPLWWLALPLPWLLAWAGPRPALDPPHVLRVPSIDPAIALAARKSRTRREVTNWQHLLRWLAWGLLVCAAARPQLPDPAAPIERPGRSLMLAVDLSASMATRDLNLAGTTVSRLDAAKRLAGDFLQRRPYDRLGLIVFGKQAYLAVPPTLDTQAVADALMSTQAGLAGNETALGDAIGLATRHLREQTEPRRTLVLLTDGAQTAGTLAPARAAWLAQREDIRIHAIGIAGSKAPWEAAPDAETLQAIASQTGGHFHWATNGDSLAAVLQQIDQLEPLPESDASLRPALELYPLPLLVALLLASALLLHQRSAPADHLLEQIVDPPLRATVILNPPPSAPQSGRRWPLLILLAVGCAMGAFPWLIPGDRAEFRATGLRILIADLSSPAHDVALRARLGQLLRALPPGDTALIVSAGDAYLAVPPTHDTANIAAVLPELAADIMPLPGSLPQAAQAQALALWQRYAAAAGGHGAIIWLSAQPDALRALPHGSLPATVIDLDSSAADGEIAAIVDRLGEHPRWRLASAAALPGLPTLLAIACLLLLGAFALRPPWPSPAAAVLPAPTLALALVLPLLANDAVAENIATVADSPPWQAVAAYRRGDYGETARLLQGRTDAVSLYNRGNALAHLQRYAEAEAAYDAALAQHPDDPDTLFNRDIVRRLRNPPSSPPPPSGDGRAPPPPSAPAPAEASRIAEQWLQGVPDDPGGLLRARLRLEHEQRKALTPR